MLRPPAVPRVGGDQCGTGREDAAPQAPGCASEGCLPAFSRSFQGFDENLQQDGTLLGQFTYDQDGEPIQTFYFQVEASVVLARVAHTFPFMQWFLSSRPVPGTRGSEQKATAPALTQLNMWDRDSCPSGRSRCRYRGVALPDGGRWGRLSGKGRCLPERGHSQLEWACRPGPSLVRKAESQSLFWEVDSLGPLGPRNLPSNKQPR